MRLISLVVFVSSVAGAQAVSSQLGDSELPRRRFELALSPAVPQLNGVWFQHFGVGAQLAVSIAPRFRVIGGAVWNPIARDTGFGDALRLGLESSGPARLERAALPELLVDGLFSVGTELGLLRGEVAPFSFPHEFEITVQGLGGAMLARVPLKPISAKLDGSVSPATSGDVGLRPTLGAGVGLRFGFLDRFSVRLDLRGFSMTSRVSRVNGCDRADLQLMDQALRSGRAVTSATVSSSCRTETFDGTDEVTGWRRSNDVPLALGKVRDPSSQLSFLVVSQLTVGVSF